MKDISNKTLAELVLLAIVVSLASTVITVGKLSTSTGNAVGQARVNVTSVVAISLPVNTADFGTLFQGATDDTTDGSPVPLFIQNDGGVNANISASGTTLFSGSTGGDDTTSFRYKARENPLETGSFNNVTSVMSFINVTTASHSGFINVLKWQDATDSALIDLAIQIPTDESAGQKSATLTFTAVQA